MCLSFANIHDERYFLRLNEQLKRIWIQRKLLSLVLFLYVTIMFGLLIILFILLFIYHSNSISFLISNFSSHEFSKEYPLIIHQNVTTMEGN